jgi:hypothetical protein
MRDWHLIRWRSAVVLTSAAVFIASLTQTGFVIADPTFGNEEVPGVGLLAVGWAAMIFEGVSYRVFPCVVAAWVFACMKRHVAAVIAALLAVGLISTTTDSTAYYAAWLANPIIAITWLRYLRDVRPASLISAVFALVLTLSFLLVPDAPRHAFVTDVSQADMVPIISYGIGYWLWVGSAAIVVAGVSADMFLFRIPQCTALTSPKLPMRPQHPQDRS